MTKTHGTGTSSYVNEYSVDLGTQGRRAVHAVRPSQGGRSDPETRKACSFMPVMMSAFADRAFAGSALRRIIDRYSVRLSVPDEAS